VCGWSVLWWQELAAECVAGVCCGGKSWLLSVWLECVVVARAGWSVWHLPARWHPSTHGTRNTGLAASELSRVH